MILAQSLPQQLNGSRKYFQPLILSALKQYKFLIVRFIKIWEIKL